MNKLYDITNWPKLGLDEAKYPLIGTIDVTPQIGRVLPPQARGGDGMKPILFNTDMVRAILTDRKTVTRRVVKPQPKKEVDKIALERFHKPYRPGDILYVRETFFKDGNEFFYKADDKLADLPTFRESTRMIYRPSIHMPHEAARIFLRVTDVRVERLQEITDDDIAKEGVQSKKGEWLRIDFADLWNSTIKKADLALYGWEANPWVWAIDFERCEKPGGD